jgi:PadR family transcriptional regulator PadR
MIPTDLIKGSLKTIVLKLLKENGRMYGYEITRKVEELTDGKIKLTYGALYPVLHKLESEGILLLNRRISITAFGSTTFLLPMVILLWLKKLKS